MKVLAQKIFPRNVRRKLRAWYGSFFYRGQCRFCPACESSISRFVSGGLKSRPGAKCPVCGSLERERLIAVFLTKWTDLFQGCQYSLLHVAPEYQLERRLNEMKNLHYVTVDLASPYAMVKMDITNIQYSQNTFDAIYCSHVLEHVPEDRKAIREFFRVLKPAGWAILQVPISVDKTIEDPRARKPKERLSLFGHRDHVRSYGSDYPDRLREAGFLVEVIPAATVVGEENISVWGINTKEQVFFCAKEENDLFRRIRQKNSQGVA